MSQQYAGKNIKKLKKNWSSSSTTPPPVGKCANTNKTQEEKMTSKKNFETISSDITELKQNVSTVLEKLDSLLNAEKKRDEDIDKLKTDNLSLKCKVASL